MKFLFIGGHADGRRIEMNQSSVPSAIAVPRREHLKAGRPIETDQFYRSVPVAEEFSSERCHLFVHESIPDEEVISHLIARYPAEPTAEQHATAH